MRFLFVFLFAACTLLAGCQFAAVHSAPAKVAATSRTDAAVQADTLFWTTLHGGDYDGIARATEALTAAYLANPRDATTAAHIGFLHIWRLSERARIARVQATITDEAVLARRYFEEAVTLAPDDARFLGFLGSTLAAEGSIHQDESLRRRGYYTLRDAIVAWPEFNLFTAGYVLSGQPAGSERYREALDWQWQTLDLCSGARVDRAHPDFGPYMALETREGPKRVCWNSWIAPHNFEGFFLNMGDMLVKAGDIDGARAIYANAKLSANFPEWKFRAVLEDRIRDAAANAVVFGAADDGRPSAASTTMMARSGYSCVACHEQ